MIILNIIIGIFLILAILFILLLILPIKYNVTIFLENENIKYNFKIILLFNSILIQGKGINDNIDLRIRILFLRKKLNLSGKNKNYIEESKNEEFGNSSIFNTIHNIKKYKEYFIQFLNKVKPEYLKIEGRYGFYDPCLTGMFTGAIYMIKNIFKKAIIILQPDFFEEILNIKVNISGRVRVPSIILIVFNIFKSMIKNRGKKASTLKVKNRNKKLNINEN